MEMDWRAVKAALREVLEEEAGYGRYEIVGRWDGGKVILQPADPGMQGREVPIDAFFKKITAVRERLRVLEQKLNNHPKLSEEEKAEFQQYVTRCYGSLTTFNFLFRNDEDRFVGTKGE